MDQPKQRVVALVLTGLASLMALPVAGILAWLSTSANELVLGGVILAIAAVTLGVPVVLGGLVFCRNERWRAAIITSVISIVVTGLAASTITAIAFGLSGA